MWVTLPNAESVTRLGQTNVTSSPRSLPVYGDYS
jgi:hypothetical protein